MLVDLSYSDIQKLQQLGSSTQDEQAKFILRNDLKKAWEAVKGLQGGRVDIILDNGAFGDVKKDICELNGLMRTFSS